MIKSQIKSFRNAFSGITQAWKTEGHLRFHFLATGVVILCGFLFHISLTEWLICLCCITLVIAAELINTAIESVVDLCSPEMHPLAGKAKDVAAGAVLVTAIGAAIIGAIIFLPKIITAAQHLFLA